MGQIIVTKWASDGRVEKFLPFETATEANKALPDIRKKFPGAFVAPEPKSGNGASWRVENNSVTHDPALNPKAPTVEETIRDRVNGDPAYHALVGMIAKDKGVTVDQVVTELASGQ